ncbi:AAA family ATPase [Micromonospora sp. NPDC049523]|uniref:AAA family ATPase n=1 Tax=Micromonospora sp. NPDC049523 TaxID=3155921 RepID=UPI0034306C36
MAKLLEAKVSGLAGRPGNVHIVFHRDLNVFWGMNGSGKTSFLKILHSALTGNPSSIARVPFRSAEITFEHNGKSVTRTVRKAARQSDLTSDEQEFWAFMEEEKVSEEEKRAFLAEVSRKLQWKTTPDPRHDRAFPHGYLPISRMTDLAHAGYRHGVPPRESTGLLNETIIDEEFARQTTALWRDYSNAALIRIRQVQEQGLAEVLSAVLSGERSRPRSRAVIPSEIAYELVTSFFEGQRIAPQLASPGKFVENYERNPLLQDVVTRISEIQHLINVAQAPQQRLIEMFAALFPRNKRLILDPRQGLGVRIGDERIPLESLSSGEKQIVRLLLECLAARSNAILIDEPELSLHVDWQNKLVSFMHLINPDAQLILATHSPEVMANVDNHKVFEL